MIFMPRHWRVMEWVQMSLGEVLLRQWHSPHEWWRTLRANAPHHSLRSHNPETTSLQHPARNASVRPAASRLDAEAPCYYLFRYNLYAFPYWKNGLGRLKNIASRWSLDLIDSFADLQWRGTSERTGEIPSFFLVIAQVVLNRDIRVAF